MALFCLDVETATSGQEPKPAMNFTLVDLSVASTGLAAAREIASTPYFVSVVLRVVSGLAAGFWLVQMVKLYVG